MRRGRDVGSSTELWRRGAWRPAMTSGGSLRLGG